MQPPTMPLVKRLATSLAAGILTTLASTLSHASEPTKVECLKASDAWLDNRKVGKLREAHAQVLMCAASSCPRDIREECGRHVGEVEAAIPTVVFIVKDAGGNDFSAVKVSVDGTPLVDRVDEKPIAI